MVGASLPGEAARLPAQGGPHVGSVLRAAGLAHRLDRGELVAEFVADSVDLLGGEEQLLADLVQFSALCGGDGVIGGTDREGCA